MKLFLSRVLLDIGHFLFIKNVKFPIIKVNNMGVFRFRLGSEKLIACGGCRLASLIIR